MPNKPSKDRVSGRLGAFLVVGLVLAAFVGLSLFGCRPHSGVVDTGEEEGGGSSKETEADPKLVSITFDSGAVSLVPAFNPNVFIYAAQLSGVSLDDLTIIGETAEEKSIISYMANGQTIGFPAKGDVFVIKVDNSTHTKASTYVVQVANDADPRVLPSAEIDGVTTSIGTVTPPIGSGNTYTVDLPHGTQRAALSAIVRTDAPYFVSYEPSNIVNNPTNDSEVIIHVIAAGMEQGTYKGVFHIADPIESFLSDINVTAGAVQNGSAVVLNFDPAVTTYSVNIPSSAASVIGVTGQANFLDSLSYTRNGAVCANGIVQNPANGDEIKIIVNGENDPKARSGYAEKIYTLNVQISPFVPAVLTDITENSGGSGTLYQGAGDSVTTTAGFSAAVTTYTFKSAPGYSGTVTFVGTHQSGNPSDVSYGGHAGGAVVNPKPSSAPLRIIAAGDNTSTLTTTYTIYFEYSFPPPPALLDSLTVFGGTGAKFKDNSSSATLTTPSAGNKVVQLTYGTPYIVLNHTCDPNFNVTYTPSNFMSPPVHDSTIQVHVDGGNDWTAADYTIKIEVGEEQHPAFTELVIDESGFNPPVNLTSSLSNNVLFYRAQLLPTMTADNVVITWKVTNETINAKTSIDGGSSWQTSSIDGSHNGGFTIVGLASGDAQIVLVKLTTSDGSSAIYTLDVSRISDSGRKLSNLKVNGRQITLPSESAGAGPFTLTPSLADIGNPISTSITLVPIINAGYSIDYVIDDDATYSLVKTGNNASLGLPAGTDVEVTIIVSAGAITETYELRLFKPDSYYVKNGGSDSSTTKGDRSTTPFLTLKKALDAAKATNGAVPKVTVIGPLTGKNNSLLTDNSGHGTTSGTSGGGVNETSNNSAFEIVNTGGIEITINGMTNASLAGDTAHRVVFIKNSKINFTNIEIKNSTIPKNGAGIYTADGTQVSLGTGALVTGNMVAIESNTFGGGVYVGAGTTFTLNGGIISGNRAYNGGGVGIESGNSSIPQGGSFVMNSGSIRSNTATMGGGIFGQSAVGGGYIGAALTITGGIIGGLGSPNTATTYGGGVCMAGSNTSGIFTMSGGEISYNSCTSTTDNGEGGGGVALSGTGDSISGGSIHHNSSGLRGGGIMQGIGTLTISGTATITENTSGWYGAGIFAKQATTITMNGGLISGNKIDCARTWPEGGGVFLSALNGAIPGAVFILNNGSISGNSVKTTEASQGGCGGGIWKDNGATLTMNGGSISGNSVEGPIATSRASGGGVFVRGSGAFAFNGGVVSGNTGNHIDGVAKGVIVDNEGVFEMGGTALVHANNDVYLETNSKIRAKSTLTSSAVATIKVVAATTAGAQIITLLDSSGNTITSNKAVTDRFTIDKGGLSISDTGYLFMVRYVKGSATQTTKNGLTPETAYATLNAALIDATFKANNTTPTKQVIILDTLYNDQGGNPSDTDMSFLLDGTAIGTPWVTITGGTLDSRNKNLSGSGRRVVRITNGAQVRFENITITSGGMSGYRGAVCVSIATTSVTFGTGTKITDYVSSEAGGGGGLAINAGTIVLDGAEISDCHAASGQSGGGVYIASGTFTMQNGSKIENCSADRGGGVYVAFSDAGTIFGFSGGTISGNTALTSGGGIHAVGLISLNGGTISGNSTTNGHGGGIYIDTQYSSRTMTNTIIENNTAGDAGGGIFVAIGGSRTFTMSSGIIRNNNQNATRTKGSGVFSNVGTFVFAGGKIYGNKHNGVTETGADQAFANAPNGFVTISGGQWTE